MTRIFQQFKIKYKLGSLIYNDIYYKSAQLLSDEEQRKKPTRTEVINFLLSNFDRKTTYLEIGVRNPNDNFNHIIACKKYGVDPGLEFAENPVDFKMTSDEFFNNLQNKTIFSSEKKFDVIFIDGLHLADQVYKDINNSLKHLQNDGFIVLHDCNPPTEWHAREKNDFSLSPAKSNWNGTTWKAFYKARLDKSISCICIDSDWGIGVISPSKIFGNIDRDINPFLEYEVLNSKRKQMLNVVEYEVFKNIIHNCFSTLKDNPK